jgi:acyl-CoA dehydrogenase
VALESLSLLGEQGQGFKLAMGALNVVRLAQVGARAVGKASHVLELMVSYVNDRKQFGQRIGDFQMMQQQIADSVIEINAARWMVYQAAWMLDQGFDARAQIAMVKVLAAETLGKVVDRAVQVFGGMGFCKELPIERYFRDARVYRIFDGTSEIHRGVVAKMAMKKGAALFDVHR